MRFRKLSRIVLLAIPLSIFSIARADDLPTDPSLTRGTLDNGMSFIVRKCSVPAGRATVWLHMYTGSLNESDKQRGIAHFTEHMAFNGSKNFPPGELVPAFQAMGLTFGRDQNAFTSYEQTCYQLTLPDTKDATIHKGMSFFADVISRLLMSPVEINNERQIILEERRRGLSGQQRARDYVGSKLYPGSMFGFRSPIGLEEQIKTFSQADFLDYYGKWYRPSNATLIVVADVEPEAIVKAIHEEFDDEPKLPKPTPQDQHIKPYEKSFAIVATDPEIRMGEARIEKIGLPTPSETTTEIYRHERALEIAMSIVNRRMMDRNLQRGPRGGGQFSVGDSGGRRIAASQPATREVAVTEPTSRPAWTRNADAFRGSPPTIVRFSTGNEARVVRITQVSTNASTDRWKQAFATLGTDLATARAYGFSATEIERAEKDLLTAANRAVETESTTPALTWMTRINNDLADDDTIMSPAQQQKILKRTLDALTADEIAKAFNAEFDFQHVAFALTLPTGASVPSESDVLAAGEAALKSAPATRPADPVKADTIAALMTTPPQPGTIAETTTDAPTKVVSAWLGNNIRVHYRFMDQQKDQLLMQVSLYGGELQETTDDRGVTQAATLAFSRPATKQFTSQQIRDFMTGRDINVRGGGFGGGRGRGGGGPRGPRPGGGASLASEAVTLSVSGKPADFETGMQLLHLMLTEPKIEDDAFQQYQTRTRQAFGEANNNPMMLGQRLSTEALYPDNEPRFKPPTPQQLRKLNIDEAQAWLDKLIGTAPLEVALVGDIPQDEAMKLISEYLGSLPTRERPQANMFADQRKIARPTGPRDLERSIPTQTDQAIVLSGFYGADDSQRDDVLALGLAARVLTTRMTTEVREADQLVYSISATSRPGSTFPGFGAFTAAAPTDPMKVDALVKKLGQMYDKFAREGPSDDEVDVAKKQYVNTYDDAIEQPAFWLARLSELTFHGISLEEFSSEPAKYAAMKPSDVRDVFAKYYTKPNTILVVVKPGNATTKPATTQADEAN